MARLDKQNRTPKVEVQPDLRLRVTDCFDLLDYVPKKEATFLAEVELPWGTPHPDYSNCRLVGQTTSGQIENSFSKPNDPPPQLFRIYEEIPQNDRVIVGLPGISFDQYGHKQVEINYIQLSAGTAVYNDVVGETTAPVPNDTAVLKNVIGSNDGTLISTKLIFSDGGELSDTETLKFNGKLVLRELTYLNEVPPTPAGWTLITQSTEFIQGLAVFRYGFANAGGGGGGGGAGGVTSTQTEYERSPDQGATGITRTTIRYLSNPSVATNPITAPAGSQLISIEYEDEDGYRLWTGVYAAGTGIVSSSVDVREGGKLVIYSKVAINAGTAVYTPSSTIGGTVTLFSTETENGARVEDGTIVTTWKWAEGHGEISRAIDYSQSSDQGVTGVTKTTIRTLVAIGGTIQPTSLAGSVLVGQECAEQDGYGVWTTTWAKGAGTVDTKDETKNNGLLLLRTIRALGAAPATPSGYTLVNTDVQQSEGFAIYTYDFYRGVSSGAVSTDIDYSQSVDQGVTGVTKTTLRYFVVPGATVQPTFLAGSVLISSSFVEQDGYRVWTTVWAKGIGIVLSDVDTREGGKLIIYHKVALGLGTATYVIPTPSPTIGGTVTLIQAETRNSDGYFIFDDRWAEGHGVVSEEIVPRTDGLREYHRTVLSSSALPIDFGAFNAAWTPDSDGVMFRIEQSLQDGYTLTRAAWMFSCDEQSPLVTDFSTEAWIPFTYPGRVKLYTKTYTTGGVTWTSVDAFLSPPTTGLVLGTKKISYQLSNALPSPSPGLWNPIDYATLFTNFVNNSGNTNTIVRGFEGYGSFPAGTATFYGGAVSGLCSVLGVAVLAGSSGIITLSGGPASPDGGTAYTLHDQVEPEAAFADVDGTQYYRRVKITATPAAQAALPV